MPYKQGDKTKYYYILKKILEALFWNFIYFECKNICKLRHNLLRHKLKQPSSVKLEKVSFLKNCNSCTVFLSKQHYNDKILKQKFLWKPFSRLPSVISRK